MRGAAKQRPLAQSLCLKGKHSVRSVKAFRDAPAFAEEEATIGAPIEKVWGVLSDLGKWPDWNESVSRMTSDLPG